MHSITAGWIELSLKMEIYSNKKYLLFIVVKKAKVFKKDVPA